MNTERKCVIRRDRIVGRLRKAGLTLLLFLSLAAPAQAGLPDDPGSTGRRGGWQHDQWNFLPGTGVDAPLAWNNLIAVGRPGATGVTVAVLDTGLAYEDRGSHRRSPDISRYRLAPGRDFCPHAGSGVDPCAGQDANPDDDNGHGTHVASTIGEATANGVGETGLAYGVTLMPVRVLDRFGSGDEESISAGIEWAARHGAQVINLSFEFGSSVKTASEVPKIARAVRDARRRGAIVVAAAGNSSAATVAYPAALPGVVSVGAVTADGCLANYSDIGPGLDLVAPGGGQDAKLNQPGCDPDRPGRPILQLTFTRKKKAFHLPTDFEGTSMAAPHVSATAALVIASGVLGRKPSPDAIERRLKATARDLGPPGRDTIYGAGMVDAGAATSRQYPAAGA